jgi:hypothetical protein
VAEPADFDHQLEELCRVLNYFRVGYIVFGSHVARLNGVPVETVDVDVVPARMVENLTRLAEALNLLRPRWRVEGIPEGMKIDGGLEARHFLGDSAAIGLVTRLGPVDVVLEPQGLRGRLHRAHRRVDEGAPRRCRDPGRGPRRPHPVEGATAPGQGRRAPGRPVPAVPRACSRVATRASRPPVTAVAFRILHGSSSQAKHCREQQVHWVTYRRAPLAVPAMLPVLATVTVGGKTRQIAWAEEKVQLKGYGKARQLTLFEHGRPVLQILTSDYGACPAGILDWLKSRWREENFLKYASDNYGIDKICDYAAEITVNTKVTKNPARKTASAAVRAAENELAAAGRGLAALLADPDTTPAAKNKAIPAANRAISTAKKNLKNATAARKNVPAKLPADQIDPEARTAVLRAGRRCLQMVLRLLAHNAEHWLSGQLNTYLRDDDEYRAITRETVIRGLAGTITFTPAAITVALEPPGEPRVARALALLIDEINHTPPAIPGDNRPITYRITPKPGI